MLTWRTRPTAPTPLQSSATMLTLDQHQRELNALAQRYEARIAELEAQLGSVAIPKASDDDADTRKRRKGG